MNRNIVTLFAALLLGACGSPPKLAMPDGGSRSPANTPAAIEDYLGKATRQSAEMREQTELGRQVEVVTRDVAALKLYMAAMAAQLESPPAAPARIAATASITTRAASDKAKLPQTAAPVEAIKVGDDSILFRMMFSMGASAFDPSKDFQQKLLKAASDGRRVEIRSGSDAVTATASNKKVLKDRVDSARQYLIANGVSPEKIRTRFFSAGGFIADNSTAEGRSRNRRTEIEISGLSTSAYRETEKQQGGATQ